MMQEEHKPIDEQLKDDYESEGSSESDGEVMGESWRDYPLSTPQASVEAAQSPLCSSAEENQASRQGTTGKRWYPGKFLGYKPRVGGKQSPHSSNEGVSTEQQQLAKDEENDEEGDEQHCQVRGSTGSMEDMDPSQGRESVSSSSSRWFTFRGRSSNTNNSASASNNAAPISEEAARAESDAQEREESEDSPAAQKRERMIAYVARTIRKKFLERQLVGKIFLYRIAGVISTSMLVEIHLADIEKYLAHEQEKMSRSFRESVDTDASAAAAAKSSYAYNRALSLTDTILNSLERRSRAWDGVEFAEKVYITRGSTIGVSDPFLGIVGYSLTLELTATAGSLLASRKRFEAARDAVRAAEKLAKMQEQGGEDSFYSRTSFSFFRSPSMSLSKSDNCTASTKTATSPLPASPNEDNAAAEECAEGRQPSTDERTETESS